MNDTLHGITLEYKAVCRGYPIAVLKHSIGYRCGYVGLPKVSKFYGSGSYRIPVRCHGGLTFWGSSLPNEYSNAFGDEDLWWIGFDCYHWGDNVSLSVAKYHEDFPDGWEYHESSDLYVRSLLYVINELKKLTEQLEALQNERKTDGFD